VTTTVAEIVAGKTDALFLGNLTAKRDWGYAPEFVEAMWRMLQAEQPDDYVVATGEMHSVEELVETAFALVGRDWHDYVKFDERYLRPNEVDELCGDFSKAREKLGWAPKTTFRGLVRIMLENDLRDAGIDPADVMTAKAEAA
jgi:GDPmannose 4,6-dehydratase